MKTATLGGFALTLGLFAVSPFQANDTGGIIAWSPGYTHREARHVVADYCAGWGKDGYISSVQPRYGGYIGFRCVWPRFTYQRVARTKRVTLPIDK